MADVPSWVDMSRLCREICASDTTVEEWVRNGTLPPPRMRGKKRMWKWKEVDDWLTNGRPDFEPDAMAREIRDGTRREAESGRNH